MTQTFYCSWCGDPVPIETVKIDRVSAVGICDNDGIVAITDTPP